MGPETITVMDHTYRLRYVCWYDVHHFTAWVRLRGTWWHYNDCEHDGRAQQVVPPFPFSVATPGEHGTGPTAVWYVRVENL